MRPPAGLIVLAGFASAVQGDGERTTAPGVEEGGEQWRRVKIRNAQPTDPTVTRHETGGVAVADQTEILETRVAVERYEGAKGLWLGHRRPLPW